MKLFRRRRFESEMDDELRFHIDAFVEDLVRGGMKPGEAERLARIEFGAVEAKKDECRQAWGLQWVDELRADIVFTVRTLRRAPGFAAIAILSLALGIGANTALFGMLDALLLRSLPVREPGQLVFVQVAGTQGTNGGPPYPCFELLRDKAGSFAGMAAFSASGMGFHLNGVREQVRGLWVSGNFYELLGVRAVIGRALRASDDRVVGRGGPDGPVAVISTAYWEQRFGGDPAVVGRAVQMDDQAVTIVGVMPTEAMAVEPGRPIDMAAPMMLSDPRVLRDGGSWWLDIVARLKPGVREGAAAEEANALYQGFMRDARISPAIRKLVFDHMVLTPAGKGMDGLRKRFTNPLTALMILAGLALLAACANVASLLMARAAARQREFAVRLAIGAGRRRLIRQTLTESLVLVSAGAALGIAIAAQAQRAVAAFLAEANGLTVDLRLNGRLLLFTVVVSVFTGVAFGLAPALRAAGVDPATGFQGGSRGVAGNRQGLRLGRVLVVLQVALSMALLSSAGLFVRSLHQLELADRGFTREATLTMEVTPEKQWNGTPEWLRLQTEILNRVMKMPGVRSAGWATMSPLSGRDRGVLIDIPGTAPRPEPERSVHLISVSPEYLGALGVKLLAGRLFAARDAGNAPKVAILNETASRFYFGAANPIGAKLRITAPRNGPEYEIVGVIQDVKHANLREPAWRFLYLPIPQSIDRINRVALAVRTSGDAAALGAPIAKEIRGLDASLLISNVVTMEKLAERSMSRERLVAGLSTVFGMLALVLAATGLYGTLAYAVTRRTNEIGIRMALGASAGGVTWMVLREALWLAAAGMALGTPAVAAIGGFSRALLYGVDAFDWVSFICAVVVLAASAALAALVPARRASRLDPMPALRCE